MKKFLNISFLVFGAVFLVTLTIFSCSEPKYPDSKTPQESLAEMQLDDRFEIQLFASEPVVQDPVSMIFDEKGDVYVVEMPDYPFKPETGPGAGRIKKLIDADGDGVMEDFVIFADQITDATSVFPWKDGLLVTAAPNIWYMKDTDGDGQADEKEILFSGFFQNNQEAQITNLRFNVDNWIYASNHGQQGQVQFTRKPDSEPLSVAGGDFRFRLDTEEFEQETGPGQFGHAFDNFGHRFVTQNTIHIQQMVMPWRYTHRHPYLPATRAMVNISDHDLRMYQLTEAPYWRKERSARRQKAYDEQGLDRIEHVDNHFTGASGGTFYGGGLFPKEFDHSIFTGEVMGGLVHQDVLVTKPGQVVYTASRAGNEQESEFLASTDMWFRPTNFTVGPDGALYMVDYYRQHIETPLSIPEDLMEDMDFMAGSDMGRIYRIVPKGSDALSLAEIQGEHSVGEYLDWLTRSNKWYRLQAQRMLLQMGDPSIIPSVEEIFRSNSDPVVQLHALYLIDGLGGLNAAHVRTALQSPEPGLREHALQLAENFPELLADVIRLKDDPSARVVMQTALSLGNFTSDQVIPALGDILNKNYKDHWMRMAVLSSEPGSSMALMKYLDGKTSFFESWDGDKQKLLHDFTYITAARNDESSLLALVNEFERIPADNQASIWKGLAAGLKRGETTLTDKVKARIGKITESADTAVKEALAEIL